MSQIEIRKVTNKKMRKEFVKLPWTAHIYDNDPVWVPQLVGEQVHFVDPKKGYFFEFGEADLFIAYRDGKPVGRISAHVNHLHEKLHDNETGFFGFYESINDIEVARALFSTAEQWLKERGKTKMLGPEGWAIYDAIGFVTEGLDIMPVVGLNHFAGYYKDLAEQCGFQKAVDWYCILVGMPDEASQAFLYTVKTNIMKSHTDMGIEYRELKIKELMKRIDDMKTIFNVAWEKNWGHIPLTDKQFDMLFHELKDFLVPELAIFAEKEGKTIGFILSMPDINPSLKLLDGHLYPWRLVKFLLNLKKAKKLRTILMGVLPEYRGIGIDNVLVLKTIENGTGLGFESSDCSLIVETNVKMINSLRQLKAKTYKTYRLYERPIK